MPTKDRLFELNNVPTNADIAVENETKNSKKNKHDKYGSTEETVCHVIGSGGKLAEFFHEVETISHAIGIVNRSVEEVERKQDEILSAPADTKLKSSLEDLKVDIKTIVDSKIRAKVTFICQQIGIIFPGIHILTKNAHTTKHQLL